MQIQTCQRTQFLTEFDYSRKDLSDGDGNSEGCIVGCEQFWIRKKMIIEIYLFK